MIDEAFRTWVGTCPLGLGTEEVRAFRIWVEACPLDFDAKEGILCEYLRQMSVAYDSVATSIERIQKLETAQREPGDKQLEIDRLNREVAQLEAVADGLLEAKGVRISQVKPAFEDWVALCPIPISQNNAHEASAEKQALGILLKNSIDTYNQIIEVLRF